MSELARVEINELQMWSDDAKLKEIRSIYASQATDLEFKTFVELGKKTGLNPFLREMWIVKFGSAPASIFIGRDGYRKTAQMHAEYDYHRVDAVYLNDKFGVVNGEPAHEYRLADRGKLMGAYCIAKRRSSSQPHFVFVELNEYNTGKSNWASKPATMIKKVAEAQALRQAFQDMFGGTYDESEEFKIKDLNKSEEKQDLKDRLNDIAANSNSKSSNDDIVIEFANPMQILRINKLLSEKDFGADRLDKALDYYQADGISGLTIEQAEDFLVKLEKI